MVSGQDTTRKWVDKFCELMDWFLSLEKVTGDNFGEASNKGLAANYLAVKLGMFDESPATGTPSLADRGLPYESHLWDPDHLYESVFEQRKQWRHERMTHWKRKAEQDGVFRDTPFVPEVTEAKVNRYCDCIESIIYRANGDWTMAREVEALVQQANDLVVSA